MSGMPDVRELSFQNVIDTILKPAGIKVGGYPEEIFQDLTEEEKDKWICNICYLIVREARQCDNKHLLCRTCVFAWSMTYGENSQKCPMCRSDQPQYQAVKEIDRSLQDRSVLCPETGCGFKSPLKAYLLHSHGRQRFVNDREDLESLRPSGTPGSRMVILVGQSLYPFSPLTFGGERVIQLRDQLTQGRMMLHQMMLLLHLEMQLRQRAIFSFTQTQEHNSRIQRLDEVLALNEQLNEVGGILSTLLSIPSSRTTQDSPRVSNRTVSSSRDGTEAGANGGQTSINSSTSRSQPPSLRQGPISSIRFQSLRDRYDEESDSDSSSSSDSTIVLGNRRYGMSGQNNFTPRNIGTSTRTIGTAAQPNASSSSTRPQRRSDIRQQLYSSLERDDARPGNSDTTGTVAPRLLHRATSRADPPAVSGITSNERAHTTIQRLGDTSPRGASIANRSPRELATSLPPINSSTSRVPTTRTPVNSSTGTSSATTGTGSATTGTGSATTGTGSATTGTNSATTGTSSATTGTGSATTGTGSATTGTGSATTGTSSATIVTNSAAEVVHTSSPTSDNDSDATGAMAGNSVIPHGSSAHQQLMREMAPSRRPSVAQSNATINVVSTADLQASAPSLARQVSTEPNRVAPSRLPERRQGTGVTRPNSVARQRGTPQNVSQPSQPGGGRGRSNVNSTDGLSPRRPSEQAQRRATDTSGGSDTSQRRATDTSGGSDTSQRRATDTSGGSYAPQRRATDTSGGSDTSQRRATDTSGGSDTSQRRATDTSGGSDTSQRRATDTSGGSDTSQRRATDTSGGSDTSQRRATDTSGGSYAPQRRFSRESTKVDNQNRNSRVSVSVPSRENRNKAGTRTINRRKTISKSRDSNNEQTHGADPETEVSPPRTTRRASRGSQRPAGPTRGNLPTTPGQLLRARRRSEIQDELRNIQNK